MAKNPLFELYEAGTSVWLDYISRSLMTSGELKRMIEEDAVVGMTSNPTIFEKAIGGSSDYDEALKKLLDGRKCLMRGEIRMQRRHRHVAVAHGLIVGAIVRLPLVLPFLDPIVVAASRVDALVDDSDVVALGLDGDAKSLVRSKRNVDVEKRELRHAALEHCLGNSRRGLCRGR